MLLLYILLGLITALALVFVGIFFVHIYKLATGKLTMHEVNATLKAYNATKPPKKERKKRPGFFYVRPDFDIMRYAMGGY